MNWTRAGEIEATPKRSETFLDAVRTTYPRSLPGNYGSRLDVGWISRPPKALSRAGSDARREKLRRAKHAECLRPSRASYKFICNTKIQRKVLTRLRSEP